jgi:AcrR family transcriptional regulator
MAGGRRIGSGASDTRAKLLRAAEDLMREEGYAQVTSRKLASKAGLKPQLVHYYFRSMDDLFEELFRLAAVEQLAAVDRAAAAPDPLTALFALNCDPSSAALQLEFLALANHRKGLSGLIAEFGAVLNQREAEILEAEMARRGWTHPHFTSEQIASIFQTSARGLAFSGRLSGSRFTSARDAILAWLSHPPA